MREWSAMDMLSREQYLESVRQEYRQASRKQKTTLLNEARGSFFGKPQRGA